MELTSEGVKRTHRVMQENERVVAFQRHALATMGLTEAEVQRVVEPLLAFRALLEEDMAAAESTAKKPGDP